MSEYPVCPVPAGDYLIGSQELPASRPPHTVRLAAFAIGQSAVTNAEYAVFMGDGGYTTRAYWTEMGWRWLESKAARAPGFWDDPRFHAPAQPVVGVCWYEALAFTRWLAAATGLPWRLPTEAEWEAAARGPDGDAPARPYNTAEQRQGRAWPSQPGRGAAWCGALDLCGNVWEWCSTRWGRNWQTLEYRYPYTPGDGREHLEGSHARVIRGGSWFDPLTEAQPANRGRYLPGSRGSNIGFRLARSLPE